MGIKKNDKFLIVLEITTILIVISSAKSFCSGGKNTL